MSHTQSQQETLRKLHQLARLHFSGSAHSGTLACRLNPLIAGPTGCGKSFLIEQAARDCKAHYFKITYGDWIAQGARHESTVSTILRTVSDHPRVLLHIDELDKFGSQATGVETAWARSVQTDIWNVLDYHLPALTDDVADHHGNLKKLSASERKQFLRKRMWIVGSGTWQELFEDELKGSRFVGFSIRPASSTAQSDLREKIRSSKIIPPELTARFNGDILLLRYPSTAQEVDLLLETFGLTEIAGYLGKPLDVSHILSQIPSQGMRVFETLKTHLLTEALEQRSLTAGQTDLTQGDASSRAADDTPAQEGPPSVTPEDMEPNASEDLIPEGGFQVTGPWFDNDDPEDPQDSILDALDPGTNSLSDDPEEVQRDIEERFDRLYARLEKMNAEGNDPEGPLEEVLGSDQLGFPRSVNLVEPDFNAMTETVHTTHLHELGSLFADRELDDGPQFPATCRAGMDAWLEPVPWYRRALITIRSIALPWRRAKASEPIQLSNPALATDAAYQRIGLGAIENRVFEIVKQAKANQANQACLPRWNLLFASMQMRFHNAAFLHKRRYQLLGYKAGLTDVQSRNRLFADGFVALSALVYHPDECSADEWIQLHLRVVRETMLESSTIDRGVIDYYLRRFSELVDLSSAVSPSDPL